MSMLTQLKAGLNAGWKALDDLKSDVQYTRITRGAYNPATGAVTQSVTTVPVTMALVDYTDEQRSKSPGMQASDMRAILLAGDLPFRPNDEDQIKEADGTLWTIKQVAGDKRLYWDLRLRQ